MVHTPLVLSVSLENRHPKRNRRPKQFFYQEINLTNVKLYYQFLIFGKPFDEFKHQVFLAWLRRTDIGIWVFEIFTACP